MKYTGIYLGGLEVGQHHYIALNTYSKEYSSPVNSQNVRLDYFSKKSEGDPYTATVWLTNYEADDNIKIKQSHLVKIDDSTFVALWTEEKYSNYQSESSLYYAIVSDTGKILLVPTHIKGVPSPGNMSPLVKENTIAWYYAKEAGYRSDSDPVEIYTLAILRFLNKSC